MVYQNLKFRKATDEEYKQFMNLWPKDFCGFVVDYENVTGNVVLRGSRGNTPTECYRVNADHTALIRASYSQYDVIVIDREGNPVKEILDVEDRFPLNEGASKIKLMKEKNQKVITRMTKATDAHKDDEELFNSVDEARVLIHDLENSIEQLVSIMGV